MHWIGGAIGGCACEPDIREYWIMENKNLAREDREILQKARVSALVSQIQTGKAASAICTLMLSILFVSTEGVGLSGTAVWIAAMISAYLLRNYYVSRLMRPGISLDKAETGIALSSAALAIVINAPAALFMPLMTPVVSGLYVGFMIGWLAIAVVIIGIHVKSYLLYIAIGFGFLITGYWISLPVAYAIAGTLGSIAASLMFFSFAKRVEAVFEESVLIRHERDGLVQQLTISIAEAQDAQNQRSRFLAAAAHDLLQPVHALMLLSGVLQNSHTEQDRSDALAGIRSTTESIESMFRGLLDIARLDQGAVLPSLTDVQLPMIFRSVEAAYRARCDEKGVEFFVSCPEHILVRADAALLDRVVRNLVDNAVKYTELGKVSLTAKSLENRIQILITDTGSGVSPEQETEIFDAFYRAMPAGPKSVQGIGLGLSVAKQIVELMEGDIRLTSKLGVGTEVEVGLKPGQSMDSEGPESEVLSGGLPSRVLVIEDDSAARNALHLWLRNNGVDVVSAESLSIAIEKLEHENFVPEHALVDFQLGPGPNGIEVIRLLRRKQPGLPATLISGAILESDVVEGDVRVLRKPLMPEKLKEILYQPH